MTALEGLDGVLCIANNILVFGEDEDSHEAEKDNDRRFVALMERCSQKNVRLNPSKLQFKLKEVKFMGNIITHQGMQADTAKVSAITSMPAPRNKAGVQWFIGMANYLSPYCPNLSTTIRPLNQLMHPERCFLHVGTGARRCIYKSQNPHSNDDSTSVLRPKQTSDTTS